MSMNNILEVQRIAKISFHRAKCRYRLFLDGFLSFAKLMATHVRKKYKNAGTGANAMIRKIMREVGLDYTGARTRYLRFRAGNISEAALFMSRKDYFIYVRT